MRLNVDIAAVFRSALALWRRHLLEASLAVLGVVTGCGGLVVVAAVAEGARGEMDRALGALGAGTIVVKSLDGAGIGGDRGRAVHRLLGRDLRHEVPIATRVVTASSATRDVQNVKVVATERGYEAAFGLAIDRGRFIAAHDSARGDRVCVLGSALARELFPRGDALGSAVRLATTWYRVIGVIAAAVGVGGSNTPDPNRLVVVPLAAEGARVPLDTLVLSFADEADMVRAGAAVQRIVEYGAPSGGFDYEMPVKLIREKLRLQRVVGELLAGITFVLLVVGGVSIANVMLMNVWRRRPEIGLRRAVGATRTAILVQFLCEAMVVCGAGGLLGVLAGLGATAAIAELGGWPVEVVGGAALAALAVSLLLGALAGGYPAYLAARVEPTRAMG